MPATRSCLALFVASRRSSYLVNDSKGVDVTLILTYTMLQVENLAINRLRSRPSDGTAVMRRTVVILCSYSSKRLESHKHGGAERRNIY